MAMRQFPAVPGKSPQDNVEQHFYATADFAGSILSWSRLRLLFDVPKGSVNGNRALGLIQRPRGKFPDQMLMLSIKLSLLLDNRPQKTSRL